MASAKCAHPACDCQVDTGGSFGKYCSEHCKHAGNITELRCDCQHLECRTGGRVAPGHDAGARPGH
jgi:hypothetical protein